MKNREEWQKTKYSKFWSNQVKKYGFDPYCQGLYNLILSNKPSSVYELAIGTGWPFAKNFFDLGISVSGSDISSLLVSEIKMTHPKINVTVSSYQDIIKEQNVDYDIIYCFRSSWYFPNILQAVEKMFMIVKPGGLVIFDIMNDDSKFIKYIKLKHRILIPITLLKNILKVTLNQLFKSNYLVQNIWCQDEIPVSLVTIENYLKNICSYYNKYSMNQIETNLNEEYNSDWKNDSKITFVCKSFV